MTTDFDSILQQLYDLGPITTKSDFARAHVTEMVALCQMGYISTHDPKKLAYSNIWRLTPAGLDRVTNQHYYA